MMRLKKYSLFVGLIILLAVLAIPGAAASDSTQPGYITVGLMPVAQFDAHYAAYSVVPTLVSFTDTSLGSTPMTYQWDFGDGSTSTNQNPTHSYIQRGTYTVTLTVKNAYGTDTAIKKDCISIGMAPKADFVANPTSGNVPMNIAFTDKSTGIATTWNWNFGDGTGSTEQNPSHTYWTAGVYTVTLTVSNDYGSSYSTKNQYITIVGNLVSKFSANPATGKAPLTVTFTDLSLGTPTTWNWDFADNTTSTVQNPSHTFNTAGLYKVTLTVTRGTDTDSSIQTLNVGGVPQVDFAGNPRSVSTGDMVQFTDTSLNSPASWAWNFGDTATSTNQNPSHSYQVKGIYTVTLSAQNTNGIGTETKKGYINVGIPPTADFIPVIAPYVIGKVPMSVNFIDKSTGLPSSWNWNFGDGSTSADQNPSHVYQTKGIYTVTLTVKNTFGSDTMVKKGLISVGNGGGADFSASATTVGVGWIVSFTDLSTFAPTQWSWDFGDGTTGLGPKPDHVYHTIGVYDVSLTASSPYFTDSVTKKQYITVLNIPRADFVADKIRGGAPMNVTFTDKSSNGPTSWKWDFGDGATSTDQNPSHTYTTLGSYTVTLTASNVNGQDSTTKVNYIITTLAPVAAFSADRRIGNAPFLVQFTDMSSNNPTSWKWNFGDSATSTEQNPRHIYQAEGSYNVSLTVTNQYGSDTSYKSGISAPTITAAPTTVSVTAAPTTAATVVATTIPMTTQAPMPAAVSVVASVIAVLAIVSAKRK
ncbi:PKD domain-containing protein [Methanoregula sp.]|jgi:PKD repeat protein|uniref:PKD domain-containing protein n=1 Tax=Methanoregula sp. TaxID=2052170 RepID=UPI0025F70AF7|nr:PKD domain-containing protein [Methanoregula sp.]